MTAKIIALPKKRTDVENKMSKELNEFLASSRGLGKTYGDLSANELMLLVPPTKPKISSSEINLEIGRKFCELPLYAQDEMMLLILRMAAMNAINGAANN